MAATERLPLGGSPYGQKVVFCANDWQAALVPVYLKQHQRRGEWMDARSSFIVHNMVCLLPLLLFLVSELLLLLFYSSY